MMEDKDQLIEELAELEHEQWMEWSKSVLDEIMGDVDRTKYEMAKKVFEIHQRWLESWKPYPELPEDAKEKDREWAEKVIEIVEEYTMDEEELDQLKEMYDELQHSVPSDWDVPAFNEAMGEFKELLSDMEDDTDE